MTLTAHIEGIAFWSPTLQGWAAAANAFRGEAAEHVTPPAARPAPTLLAANERRRAPDTVLVALQVAADALADASLAIGDATRDLASVFVSTHGDLPITDALCSTLAANPLLLSPTRFHHSVHNAASGYWAIASGSHGPSTALAAHHHSFAVGLLEALSQCVTEQRRVLLVAYDTAACGALASVNPSRGLLGVALLLAPPSESAASARWSLQARLHARPQARVQDGPLATTAAQVTAAMADDLTLRSPAARSLQDNAMAGALPVFERLARGEATSCSLALSPATQLELIFQPLT